MDNLWITGVRHLFSKKCADLNSFLYIISMDYTTYWKRVKQLIKAHKMTQQQFADYLGVSVNTFQGWIRNDRIPDTPTAYEIAVALGVTLDYLLTGEQREITDRRLKELDARDAAARIVQLTAQIQEEALRLRPLKINREKEWQKPFK